MKVFKIFGRDEIDEILDIYSRIGKTNIESILFKLKNILVKHEKCKLIKKVLIRLQKHKLETKSFLLSFFFILINCSKL